MNPSSFSITNLLVGINVAIFFGINFFMPEFRQFSLYYYENPSFNIWQLVTHMFMHASVPHLLFNMFGLWTFGQWLEKLWGTKRFLIFYLITGVGAAVIYMLINQYKLNGLVESITASGLSKNDLMLILKEGNYLVNVPETEQASRIFHTPVVGASGALYGVLTAFAWLFPNYKLALIFLPIPIAAKFFVPALLALDLFSGVTGFSIFGGNIAHFAHIGGAIIGALLMWLWTNQNDDLIQRFR